MLKNLIKKFNSVLKIKFRLDLPEKKKLLIFDEVGSIFLKQIIKKECNVLQVREKKQIYILILLKQIFFLDFSFITYCKNYIEFTSPKVVITFIDNRIQFYEFKNHFKNIKFVSVQNGHRTKKWISQLKPNNLVCDHFFVYNNYYKEKLQKIIKSNYHVVGNIKNNFVNIDNSKINKDFLYISSYRKNSKKRMQLEKKILGFITLYLDSIGKQLHILTRSKNLIDYKEEIKYFDKIIVNKCIFKKTTNWKQSYNIIDNYQNIIFMFSSLGYEAIARKKKVAIFPTKNTNHLKDYSKHHAFTNKKFNFFNSKKITYSETKRVLNNLNNCSYDVWKKRYFSMIKDQLYFDKNNTILKKVLSNLL